MAILLARRQVREFEVAHPEFVPGPLSGLVDCNFEKPVLYPPHGAGFLSLNNQLCRVKAGSPEAERGPVFFNERAEAIELQAWTEADIDRVGDILRLV
jgi:hypothetical protein